MTGYRDSAGLPASGMVDAAVEADGTSGPCFAHGVGLSPLGAKAGQLHSSSSTSLPPSDLESVTLYQEKRRERRRKTLWVLLVLVVLGGVSCCITSSNPAFISPVEVVQTYALRLQQLYMQLTDPAHAPTAADVTAAHPLFYWSLTNLGFTVIYAVCGAMLALSGMLYQNVFRNPIAAPSMLGVSSGVQLAAALMVLFYGTAAAAMYGQRYVLTYIIVTCVLLALFGTSKLMGGRGRPLNIVNMLLTGVLINQLLGVAVTYITWFMIDEELYDLFSSMTMMIQPANNAVSWAVLALSALAAVVPACLLRFRINALTFSQEEMRVHGVAGGRLSLLVLLCGTICMVTAQVQVGTVALITLVAPHLARTIFGAEARGALVGTLLLGAVVLVACHILAVALPYDGLIPVDVVVNLVLLPAFVWMMASREGRWD